MVFLIVFSISIQNTCPFGQAGKTGFVSAKIHHCPLKGKGANHKKGKDQNNKPIQFTGQTFTFLAPVNPLSLSRTLGRPLQASMDDFLYNNICKDPPLKPPRHDLYAFSV